MKKYKLIIFDLDGTLIDSIGDYTTASNRLLTEYGCPPITVEDLTRHMGDGLKKFVLDLFPENMHDPEGIKTIGDKFASYYDEVCLESTKIYDGVLEFLAEWPGQAAIVTNKAEKHAKKVVGHLFPDYEFLNLFGADSLAEKKPHPLPLQTTMKLAGLSTEECIMVGDSEPDVRASQAAGVTSVAVSYGYTPLDKIKSLKPDHIIHEFRQLKEVLNFLN